MTLFFRFLTQARKFMIGFASQTSEANTAQQFRRKYLCSLNWKLNLVLLVTIVSGLFIYGPLHASSFPIVVLLVLWLYLMSGLSTCCSALAGCFYCAFYLIANREVTYETIELFQSGIYILAITNLFGMVVSYTHHCFAYRLFCRNQALQQMAIYDGLTGTYNRRQLTELAEREFERAKRHDTNLAVMMIDIDHFKEVNDTYGHTAGDQVLVRLTQELKLHLRAEDIAGRYGGDEFLIILPGTTLAESMDIADRFRHLVNQVGIECAGNVFCFSISIGVCTITEDIKTLSDLITNADRLLYFAKASGRNQVRDN